MTGIMRMITQMALAALIFFAVSPALAGDTNTSASGMIDAFDVNSGAGTQTNADDWSEIDNSLAGSGAQSIAAQGDANTGSGFQDNTLTKQDEWHDIAMANTNSGAQVIDSTNSNGANRTSDDVVLTLGEASTVATASLEASISGNSISASGGGGHASSSLSMLDGGGFHGFAGVTAIALSAGHNSSQNVSVNVTASVSATAASTGAADFSNLAP